MRDVRLSGGSFGAYGRWAVTTFILAVALAPAVVAQTYTVLHSFTGGSDGSQSLAELILDGGGNLYGTTSSGGLFSVGTVFKVDGTGVESVLYSFKGGVDGATPYGTLVEDAAGNLYGTTYMGGAFSSGTVFKLDPSGNETVLYSFKAGTDGAAPEAGLLLDAAGNLYGTTDAGGTIFSGGTVFKIDASGNETVLYSFQGGADGTLPQGNLVVDRAHNFYGATFSGGQFGAGTVYKLDATGHETVLYSFKGNPDGANPRAGLILDAKGNLYGTTQGGGTNNCGTVFRLDRTGRETVLANFCRAKNGKYPFSSLLLDAAGNLYGTTEEGGPYGNGSVFKLDAHHNLTVLFGFQNQTQGRRPYAGLIEDAAGNFYGTAPYGGLCRSPGCGTVYKLTP